MDGTELRNEAGFIPESQTHGKKICFNMRFGAEKVAAIEQYANFSANHFKKPEFTQ